MVGYEDYVPAANGFWQSDGSCHFLSANAAELLGL